ncbi:MAG: RidA family protein [Caulobacteraceae bacterium]
MPRQPLNPPSLYDSVQFGFSHAAVQTGRRTLHLAGQIGWDKDCQLVSTDLAEQSRQALANLKAVLAEAGATPADLVRLRTYVVDHTPDKLGPVLGAVGEFYAGAAPAPNTFVGVQSLALPGVLVEFEAVAELD